MQKIIKPGTRDWSSPTDYIVPPHTLTASDITADTIPISGVNPLADGNYNFRARLERGTNYSPWTANVPVTISTVPAGVAITWKGAATKNTGTYDQNFTLSSVPLATSGFNIIAATGVSLNTGNFSTLVVDGQTAGLVRQYIAPDGYRIGVFVAPSSGNATGDLVFGMASYGFDNVVADVWGMTGTANPNTVVGQDISGLSPTSVSLAIPANGAGIAFQTGTQNNGITWIGVTADDSRAAGGPYGNAAHTNTGGTTTVGYTMVGGTDAAASFVAWGP